MKKYLIIILMLIVANNIFAQDTTNKMKSNSSFKMGYSGGIEAGYDVGIRSFWSPGFGMDRKKIEINSGLRITSHISIVLGTGLHHYFDFDEKKTSAPLFLNTKINLCDKKISPILSLSGGYSFNIKNNFENVGFIVNSFIGVQYKIWNNFSFIGGIGLEMQKFELFLWNEPAYSNAITLNIGFSFN